MKSCCSSSGKASELGVVFTLVVPALMLEDQSSRLARATKRTSRLAWTDGLSQNEKKKRAKETIAQW